MTWREAVLDALHRYSACYHTRAIPRQALIDKELERIVAATKSIGLTPEQTLSRVLQELARDGLVFFLGRGMYLLLDTPIDIELEDLTDDALDYAISCDKLRISEVATSDVQAKVRQRRGQERIRHLTLRNYGHQCALCDVSNSELLVASHISRWADDIEGRGRLSNVLCLCVFHDALFENGYLALTDDYQVVKKQGVKSHLISLILQATPKFRVPSSNPPDQQFLRKHRARVGLGAISPT